MLARRPQTATLARHTARLAIFALTLFHGYLLGRRLLDGGLFDAGVALRWIGSAAIVVAAVWLNGRGVSMVRGRSAATFWIVVVLLHAGLGAPPITAAGEVLQTLPLGTFGLLALPAIGAHAVAEHLRGLAAVLAGQAPRPVAVRVARAARPPLSPPRAFAPLWRRPPPA